MDILFFGDFLLQKGLITKEQLDSAVDYQLEQNVCVGQIALEEKLLSTEQIEKVKEAQKIKDEKFGEMALDLGLLDEKQLDVILDKQKKRNIVFGDALLAQGVLSKETIEKEIDEFNKAQKYKKSHIYTELAFCDENQLLLDAEEIFKSLFYRSFQEHIKFQKVDCASKDKTEKVFISQSLIGDIDIEYILSFEKANVPKLTKLNIKSENEIIDLFCNFMIDFAKRVAIELSMRDIIVKNRSCSVVEDECFDFTDCSLLKFITADYNMSLYIKM